MRLGDLDAIEKFIENGLNNPDKLNAFGHDAIEILAEVHYAPTIDAVPVVRCRDCVSGPKNPHVRIFHCNVLGCGGMKPSDFCSYGERKAENPCDHCMSGSYRGCDGCSYGEKKYGE